ncbi:MAG TPA: hypothetical protein VD973_05610 [Symbiobacteriaceae bacterium]|nr:hypothetical protein [Symbiobacteriaceae bacterium]
MKLHLVTPACSRVQAALDHALTTGDLRLPPELQAHLAHCPTCAAAADSTQGLLSRLRSAPAGLPLTLLPGAVNTVLHETRPDKLERKRPDLTWFLGQLAALGGILLLLVCLLIGLAALIIQLLGNSMQTGLQPMAQVLGSPPASLLLGRETHLLVLWDYIRCLIVPKNPLRGAVAPTGGFPFAFAPGGVVVVAEWLRHGSGTVSAWYRHGTGMGSAWCRHGVGMVAARFRHGADPVSAWSRHGANSVSTWIRHGVGMVSARG